ncbi:MAG TPA: DUF2723 domain-containing protein [Roseiflexaceae bacterium]|nr:DUF2723 domain-containing protein [Roseiflexaceae bacterium]
MENRHLLTLSLVLGFLALYAATAAPSVLSGDSAEFQLAAALPGVPHPTTYPLYTVLGFLATRLVPLGEAGWRVTLLSALCAALAVGLFFALARRLLASTPAALVGALALGLAPGLWNAATLAEVYALLALLIVATALALTPTTDDRRPEAEAGAGWRPPGLRAICLAAALAGLGVSHHGLFTITTLPLLAAAMLRRGPAAEGDSSAPPSPSSGAPDSTFNIQRATFKRLLWLALCFLFGLSPLLYPPAQFALHGPFDGQDYGLPRHYFWGAPRDYGEVLDLMTGGTIRRGIFRAPSPAGALETLRMVGRRVLFEFGPFGAPLGLLGAWALARRARWAWRAAAWVFFSTLGYLLLLGPAVGDAPVFTLPMLLPWALWVAAGSARLIGWRGDRLHTGIDRRARFVLQRLAFILLVALTLTWGATRYRVSSKRHLWLYRTFAEATLGALPPGAAVIAHWEQGMTLQYLRLVEGRRPDVWVDVVEPSDDPWGARAMRRYPGRPVYFVGPPASVAGLHIELVREDAYASLFRLRR